MSVSREIVRAYRNPAASMRRQIESDPGEERLLIYLMVSIFLFFVARTPDLLETSAAQATAEVSGMALFVSNLVASFFFAPLMLYGLAALTRIFAKRFGGQGTGKHSRLALFWSLLVISPLALLATIVNAALPLDWLQQLLAYGMYLVLAVVWGSSLSESENFKTPFLTIAAIILTPFVVILLLRFLIVG